MSNIINPYRFAGEGPSPGGDYPDISPDLATVVTDGDYKYIVFNDHDTFEVDATGDSGGSDEIEYLVVAGGGPSGPSGYYGTGGGAGGYRAGTETLNSTGTGTVTVGAGGAGAGAAWPTGPANNGDDSQLELPDFTQIDASGGGGAAQWKVISGQGYVENGRDGGSGGGGGIGANASPGAGNVGGYDPVEGYDGASSGASYYQAGAGGASEEGYLPGYIDGVYMAGNGGDGIENLIATTSNGDNGYYAGGGAGYGGTGAGSGGAGGGGGGYNNGAANTGGGGGGYSTGAATSGGSGVVIIRWKYRN